MNGNVRLHDLSLNTTSDSEILPIYISFLDFSSHSVVLFLISSPSNLFDPSFLLFLVFITPLLFP